MTDKLTDVVLALSQEDLNGECFVVGAEGESEELISKNVVYFPPDFPAAAQAAAGTPQTITDAQANSFIAVNAAHSIVSGRSVQDSAKIAYIRFLAARHGLMSPEFTKAANNVRYNHSERISAEGLATLLQNGLDTNEKRTSLRDVLSAEAKKNMRKRFSDIVCCVAYIFRVRGHHYRDDINERYVSLWARCLHKDSELPASWEVLATDALHAIMPGHLDRYWETCVATARCAGALSKRFDSAPAGVAGVLALERGLDDVRMLFPGVVNKVPGAYDEFVRIVDLLKASRWGGSINCRFYGVERIRVNEGKIGALASVVLGVYEQLAPDSRLKESPALKRLAETAPATGGAIGLAARRAVQDDRMTLLDTIDQAPRFITE